MFKFSLQKFEGNINSKTLFVDVGLTNVSSSIYLGGFPLKCS